MKKQAIIRALEGVFVPGSHERIAISKVLQNIQITGDEVTLDLVITNPTLQARKKVAAVISKAIHAAVDPKAKVTTHIEVKAREKPPIKGSAIPGIKNIIAVASGKGGVGKSTVAANLAVTLVEMGFQTGLLDADIYGPSMPVMFDVLHARPTSVRIGGKSKMKPVESYGVRLLSIGFFAGADQAVVWRGPMASKALNQMIRGAHWGALDFLIIDLPPGTGDIHLSIVQEIPVDGAVIVSTPQPVALTDARRGVVLFEMKAIQVPVLGIVENMAYFTPAELPDHKYYIFGQGGARRLAEAVNVPFLGEIPLVQSIREAADVGYPTALQKGTPAQQAFVQITKRTMEKLLERNRNLPPTEAVKITTVKE
ncbi:MAG: Mrp/NBP35 family ATP-binding protein [Flavobacteriales bacterium]